MDPHWGLSLRGDATNALPLLVGTWNLNLDTVLLLLLLLLLIQIKENKQLNIQQKQKYPGSVASYDTQRGNEVGLFYNGPEHHTGQTISQAETYQSTQGIGAIVSKLRNNRLKLINL